MRKLIAAISRILKSDKIGTEIASCFIVFMNRSYLQQHGCLARCHHDVTSDFTGPEYGKRQTFNT